MKEIVQGRERGDEVGSLLDGSCSIAPTNLAVPSTTRWIDPQATSFGSFPDVCARRVDAVAVGQS